MLNVICQQKIQSNGHNIQGVTLKKLHQLRIDNCNFIDGCVIKNLLCFEYFLVQPFVYHSSLLVEDYSSSIQGPI